jgi:hypothetical protein
MSAPSAINNSKQILVGGTPSSAITTTTIKNATFLANAGEVGIFTPQGLRILETASPSAVLGVSLVATPGMDFVLAVSRGANEAPLVSDVIKGSTVTVAKKKAYAAATEQSTAIGYNGTSGLIADVATYAGGLYKVGVLVHQFLSGTDSEKIKAGYYQSQLTDSQADIALGLVKSLVQNFSREVSNANGQKPVEFKAVVNTPLANDFVFDNSNFNMTVTKGAKQILAENTGPTYNTGTLLAVGDFLRIGTAAGAVGTVALLSDVYKVVSIVGTVITLDREVWAASGTYVDNSGNITVIPASVGEAANWGIISSGTALPFDVKKKRYAKVRFDVTLNENFGSTAVTTITSASEGNGTYQQVAQLEKFLNGFRAEQYEMGEPFLFNSDQDLLADPAVTGSGYNQISLIFSNTVFNFQGEVSPKELIIAVPATTPGYAGASADDITDVLEDIIPVAAQVDGDLAI